MDPNVVLSRLLRLARLDTTVFDEVRDDERELVPALIIAVASAFLAGLGGWLYWEIAADSSPDSAFLNTFILGSIFLAVMYGVAALVVYVVLVQFYRVSVDLQAIIRTMGYAAAPLALSVLMLLPVLFPLFALLPIALLMVMMIYAVQSASNAESGQVVMACVAGLAAMMLILGIIAVSSSFPDAPIGAGQFALYFDF